jgi:alkyl hydroperoxide reductase subunit F
MYDIIVVGGGPAGLTATIYAIRKRLNVLLVSPDLGGKTNFHLELPDVESYRVVRGIEVVEKFRRELEYLEFAHQLESVTTVEPDNGGFLVHTKEGSELPTKSVLIATGARQQKLGVPGERDYLSRGLCYSALSYAPLFIDKKTIVIGNGELALRSAAELATVAEHVHLVGPAGSVLDTPLGQKLNRAENVTILEGHQVTRVKGNGYCNRVIVQSPDGHEVEIGADGTFIEMALVPNAQMVPEQVKRDANGFIKVDAFGRTSMPGIFAAGDVTDTYAEQVLVAIGEGAKAALAIYDYLLPTL